MQRSGEPVRPGVAYRFRPGVYALLAQGDDILVTEQAEPVREYQLPGGGIGPGESPLPALHRECLEETGWRIRIVRRLGAYQRFTYMPEYAMWAHKICHVYLARPVLRVGPPREPGHRAVWMPLAAAAGLLGPEGDRHFVAAFAHRPKRRATIASKRRA